MAKEELNMRDEISRLVRLLGVAKISGRRAGHYILTNLKDIPENELPTIYRDLLQIYKRTERAA